MAFANVTIAVQVVVPAVNLVCSDYAKVKNAERGNKVVIEVEMVPAYASFSTSRGAEVRSLLALP